MFSLPLPPTVYILVPLFSNVLFVWEWDERSRFSSQQFPPRLTRVEMGLWVGPQGMITIFLFGGNHEACPEGNIAAIYQIPPKQQLSHLSTYTAPYSASICGPSAPLSGLAYMFRPQTVTVDRPHQPHPTMFPLSRPRDVSICGSLPGNGLPAKSHTCCRPSIHCGRQLCKGSVRKAESLESASTLICTR